MTPREVIEAVYLALRLGNREALTSLLHPEVEVAFTPSLPAPIGGPHRGVDDCIDRGWWAIGARYAVRAEPDEWHTDSDGTVVVLGVYRGHERKTDRPFEAVFAHRWRVVDERVVSLRQITDAAGWAGESARTTPA